MRSRFFHKPLLHTGKLGIEKKATWLELFYDLVFVAAFIQLGDRLSAELSLSSYMQMAMIFVILWLSWSGFTFYINRYTVDDLAHRIMAFLQMFAVAALAIAAKDFPNIIQEPFIVSAAVAQAIVAVLYLRAYYQQPLGRPFARYWGSVFGISAALWLVSLFVPTDFRLIVWVAAVVCVMVAPFSRASRSTQERYPLDHEHLSERFALLTIIVLGESFVKVLSAFSTNEMSTSLIFQAVLMLLITCTVWWVYFDDIAGAETIEENLKPLIWFFAHLPLQVGIIGLGVALKKIAFLDLEQLILGKYAWLLCGNLSLIFLAVGIIDTTIHREHSHGESSTKIKVNSRIFTAVLFLGLAMISPALTGTMLIIIVATIGVAIIVFDLMIAPSHVDEMLEVDYHEKTAQMVEEDESAPVDIQPKRKKDRIQIGEAIHKGTPRELQKDIYFFFMEGTWKQTFLSILFLYVLTNVFFAMLYMMNPGSIGNADTRSFLDAFFFSVQTMSTIGYGAMSPGSLYGDIIVTVEAAVGLIGVALVTGLMFAKASRPRTSVLFSDAAIISRMDGKLMLSFRTGNVRGNDIVGAEMSVSALIDTHTKEGEHIRRVVDLPLVRHKTQWFRLTWLIMHEIDKKSALYDVDWDKPGDSIMGLTAMLIGHDGTYSQTIYARHTYYPEDIVKNAVFEDMISTLPDGRLMLDYGNFHRVKQQTTEQVKPKGKAKSKAKAKTKAKSS